MNMTDPVADMISRIRNGVRAKLPRVDIPSSKLKAEIARILKDEGYIANFKVMEDQKQGMLRVFLKYGPGMERVITDLQRVSRPGCRIYCGKGEIPRVYGGPGHQHPVHVARRHDRPDRRPRRCGRRDPRQRLVRSASTCLGSDASPSPSPRA